MPLTAPMDRLSQYTNPLPKSIRYLLALIFVMLALCLRAALEGVWADGGYPFLFFFGSVLAAASLGRGGAGYLATGASTMVSLAFIPPVLTGWDMAWSWALPLVVFTSLGTAITAVIETLHHALAELHETQRRRTLLLREFRHRGRNDLASIGARLLLRARTLNDPTTRAVLSEAAKHTRDLAMIHTRLEDATHDRDDVPIVDSRYFLAGLCADMRPPVNDVLVISHAVSTERAVSIGMALVELTAEATEAGATEVGVRFGRCGGTYLLRIIDNRPVLIPTDADLFRGRLITGLVRQLRGTFGRTIDAENRITASLRFPVVAPSLTPAKVGI